MGNISGQDELVTKQELAAFYQAILPYLNNSSSSDGGTTYTAGDGIDIINDIISTKKSTQNDMDEIIDTLPTGSSITTVSGYTPLGTIISYYGETAPKFYLACDGSEYNKSDYPELANHLLSLTNHTQYEVDGNDTKFKVPDLRGEFLRGTGINSHENQGGGGSVGEHQDGTVIPTPFINDNRSGYATDSNGTINGISNSDINVIKKSDNSIVSDGSITLERRNWSISSTTTSVTNNASIPRPTNTSVLYCIAYKDIYTNPMNDYSTDEKVVGTWINGKPLYQKTIDCGALPNATEKRVTTELSNIIVRRIWGYSRKDNAATVNLPHSSPGLLTQNIEMEYGYSDNSIVIVTQLDRRTFTETYVTLQYTKNAD